MEVYVLTIKEGCCNHCAETYIIGVFTRLDLVNKYLIDSTIYGKVAQFTGYTNEIEIDDDNHGLVVLTLTTATFFGGVEEFEEAIEVKGHRCLVCGRLTINYHGHEVK